MVSRHINMMLSRDSYMHKILFINCSMYRQKIHGIYFNNKTFNVLLNFLSLYIYYLHKTLIHDDEFTNEDVCIDNYNNFDFYKKYHDILRNISN